MLVESKQKHGGLLHSFSKYVSLNVLGMLGLSCYILADTFFVARGLGSNGITALNLAIPIYSFINGSGLLIGMGGATRFTILKDDKKQKNQVFAQAIWFALIVSTVFLLIGLFFSNDLSRLLGANPEVLSNTNVYIKTILVFAPMLILNNVVLCFVRNDGNPKLAMTAMVVGSLSNIVLDYIFIFPLNMGMFGAAFATGCAPVISLIILSIHFLRGKNSFTLIPTKLQFPMIKDICALGNAFLITEVSTGILMIVFNTIILGIAGNIGVAAYGIIANLSLVVVAIFTGIAQGVQPLLSSNYGKGNKENLKKLYQYAVVTASSLAIMIYIVAAIFAEPIVNVFNKDHIDVLSNLAKDGIILYFIGFIFVGFNIITAILFSSTDQPKYSFVISILRGLIIVIPMVILLSMILGINGVWLTIPITEALVSIFAIVALKRYSKQ